MYNPELPLLGGSMSATLIQETLAIMRRTAALTQETLARMQKSEALIFNRLVPLYNSLRPACQSLVLHTHRLLKTICPGRKRAHL